LVQELRHVSLCQKTDNIWTHFKYDGSAENAILSQLQAIYITTEEDMEIQLLSYGMFIYIVCPSNMLIILNKKWKATITLQMILKLCQKYDEVAQDRSQWRALVNMVMNHQVL
jgi:hypothetical protein